MINKSFSKVPLSENKKKHYKFIKKVLKQKFTCDYDLPVASIDRDRSGNVYVQVNIDEYRYPELKDKYIYDVFNNEGIFLNRLIYDEILFFKGNYAVKYSSDNFIVYEY